MVLLLLDCLVYLNVFVSILLALHKIWILGLDYFQARTNLCGLTLLFACGRMLPLGGGGQCLAVSDLIESCLA
jgi:hypothetical protein